MTKYSRPVFYMNNLINFIRRNGLAHSITDTKATDTYAQITLSDRKNTIMYIDIGVTDNKPNYYMEILIKDEVVYEKHTDVEPTLFLRIKKTFIAKK